MRRLLILLLVISLAGCAVTTTRLVRVQDAPHVYVPGACEDSLRGATTAQLEEMFGEPIRTSKVGSVTAMSFNVPVMADHSATAAHILVIIQADRAIDVICQDAEVNL